MIAVNLLKGQEQQKYSPSGPHSKLTWTEWVLDGLLKSQVKTEN
jgi:hypothetical protein